mmetsp:Transcript_15805/g.37807  ORF Transcript_15805/g.37807 Transcript_15805/m.37807 type:complete len:346 (-) Transcript_15805:298-1335(-)
MDQAPAPRPRGVLQAHLLRHHQLPVHGGHPVARVRQQVRVLLAPSQEPRRPGVAMEDGRPQVHRRRGRPGARPNDQGDQGHPRRQDGPVEGGPHRPALRAEPGGGAHHVPSHQRVPGRAARAAHLDVPGNQRAASRCHRAAPAHHPAVRQRRCAHPRVARGHRPSPVPGCVGSPPPFPPIPKGQGPTDRGKADGRQGVEFRRGRGIRRAHRPWPLLPSRDEGRHLLRQVRCVQPQHEQLAVASRGGRSGHPAPRRAQSLARGRRRRRPAPLRVRLRAQALGVGAVGAGRSVCVRRSRDRRAQVEDVDRLRQIPGAGHQGRRGSHLCLWRGGLHGRDTVVGSVRCQ